MTGIFEEEERVERRRAQMAGHQSWCEWQQHELKRPSSCACGYLDRTAAALAGHQQQAAAAVRTAVDYRAEAHRIWNEALCNSGVPGWDRNAELAAALADAERRGGEQGDALRARLRDEIAWHDSHGSEHIATNRLRAMVEVDS